MGKDMGKEMGAVGMKQQNNIFQKVINNYLPYTIFVNYDGEILKVFKMFHDGGFILCDEDEVHFCGGENCKPYLRPMETMTKDEIEFENAYFMEFGEESTLIQRGKAPYYLNWLCSRYLDVYDLIPKGLALPAPDGMYLLNNPFKEESPFFS